MTLRQEGMMLTWFGIILKYVAPPPGFGMIVAVVGCTVMVIGLIGEVYERIYTR